MFQTSYTGIKAIRRNGSYMGGFCQFYYIPVECVAVFPRVSAATQILTGEPALIPGAGWLGPIEVPRDRLGFTEVPKRTPAGLYFETKVEGLHPGDSIESRVNLENMAYHRYLIAGKLRAGGHYLLIGTLDSALRFDPEYKSGNGAGDTAQHQFTFFTEHISKAYILPSFGANLAVPETGGGEEGGGETPMANQKEVIPYSNQKTVSIPWTGARQAKFGSFPTVQVWQQDSPGELPYLSIGASIEVDAPPPSFSELIIKTAGNSTGFISIV